MVTQLNHIYELKPPQKGQKDKVPRVLGLVDTWRFREGSTPRESMKLHTLSSHLALSISSSWLFLILFFKKLFIFSCAGSLLLLGGFLWLQRGAWASHCSGFSCCRAQALGMQAPTGAAHGLSSRGSWALELRLSHPGARA